MDGWITIGTELETKEFDKQIDYIKKEIQELEALVESANIGQIKLDADEIAKYEAKIEKLKNKLRQLNKEREKTKKDTTFEGMGQSLGKAVKQAGKLALAIFGIRSAYMLLRRASSELASYNEQYATDLEYIRYALTQAIAPVLIYIVSLASQLLAYINAIVNSLFGINLFGDASAESFMKMKESAGGVASSVKEIKKQLAGFDELNVLTEDTSGGGGGGGVVAPSFDLSDLENQTTEWLNGIVNWISEHSGEIIALIGLIIAGIGAQIGAFPLVIAGILVVIWGLILQFWDDIKAWLQQGIDWLFSQGDNLRPYIGDLGVFIYQTFVEALQWILNLVDSWITTVKTQFNNFIEFFQAVFAGDWETAWKKILDIATNPIEFIFSVWTNTLDLFKNIFDHFTDFLENQGGWIREFFGDAIGDLYDKFIENVKIAGKIIGDYINMFKTVLDNVISFVKNVFTGNWQGAWENIGNIVSSIFGFIGNTIQNLLNAIWNVITGWASAIGTAVGDAISGAFKNVVNSILWGVEYVLNGPIRTINSLIGVINAIPRS